MKNAMMAVGIVLILLGITSFVYRDVTITQHEEIAKIGNVQLTRETPKIIALSPVGGGLVIAAGVVLAIAARMRRKK